MKIDKDRYVITICYGPIHLFIYTSTFNQHHTFYTSFMEKKNVTTTM